MSLLGQACLAAFLLEARYSHKAEFPFSAVAGRLSTFWRSRPSAGVAQGGTASSGLPPAALFMVLRELEACKLVLVARRAYNWGCLVKLNVPEDDVAHVLKESEGLAWLHGQLSAAV